MATRGFVGMVAADGAIRAIYHHWDSDPAGLGVTLAAHYTTPERVAALIALGDCSQLREELGEAHDFDARPNRINWQTMAYEPIPGAEHLARWSRFYGRDRGEDGVAAKDYASEAEFLAGASERTAEYAYLWRDGAWWCFEGADCGRGWAAPVPLAQAIAGE